MQLNVISIWSNIKMSHLLEYLLDRSDIWNTYSILSIDNVQEKSEFSQI